MKIEKVVVGLLKTNCYIITNKLKEVTIIDPGDEASKIIDFLDNNHLSKVTNILLTHAHSDHLGALDQVAGRYPDASLYLSKMDVDFPKNNKGKKPLIRMIFPGFKTDFITVTEKETIPFGDLSFEVIETPGHTPGSLCYLIEGNLFSGDTVFYRSFGITDFPGGDEKRMQDSLAKISKLPDQTVVYPGHLSQTTIADEKEFGYLV